MFLKKKTNIKSEGMDEIFTEYFKCEKCGFADIRDCFIFCPKCGRKIIKDKNIIHIYSQIRNLI